MTEEVMPKTIEVEFPVLVTVTVPDGYDMAKQDIVEVAFDVVSQQCSICIDEKDGQPVEWASCVAEVLTDEATVDGEYVGENVGETAGPQ
jgi:translation elongation factor EF-1beta